MWLLSLQLACNDTTLPGTPTAAAPAPKVATPAPATPASPAAPPAPAVDPPGRVRMDAQLIDVKGSTVGIIGPEGEVRYHATAEATGAAVQVGDTVQIWLQTDRGALYVAGMVPHTGLPIAYGEVTTVTKTTLALHGPLGTTSYTVNRWSDLPDGLAAGDFVSVKHYAADGAQAILNVRRHAGRVEEIGTVTAVRGASFDAMTLGGARHYDLTSATAGSVKVGDAVRIGYHRPLDGPPMDLQIEPAPEPHRFTGKMSAYDAPTRDFSMVDAWGGTLGVVHFNLPGALPAELVPGDLVDATWRIVDGRPTLDSLVERPLSQVFFGRIDHLDDTSVSLTTLQRQPKLLRRTPETWLPAPIVAGDMADVMWRADGAGFIAEAVVKE